MPEIDRIQMLRVLAEKGMGWTEASAGQPLGEGGSTFFTIQPGFWLTLFRPYSPGYAWDPFGSGRSGYADAGELLVAMKTRHSAKVTSPDLDTWGRFCQRLIANLPERTGPAILCAHGGLNSYSCFPMPRDVITALAVIGPALIAQAAYEALEGSHDH